MYSLNRAELIGNLTADPVIRVTQSGMRIASFSVATNRSVKDASGEWKEVPDYHNIVVFDKGAEIIEQYVHKGNKIYIEGSMRTSSWDDKDTGKKMYKTEVVCNNFIILTPKGDNQVKHSAPIQEGDNLDDLIAKMPDTPTSVHTIDDVPF